MQRQTWTTTSERSAKSVANDLELPKRFVGLEYLLLVPIDSTQTAQEKVDAAVDALGTDALTAGAGAAEVRSYHTPGTP